MRKFFLWMYVILSLNKSLILKKGLVYVILSLNKSHLEKGFVCVQIYQRANTMPSKLSPL